VDQLPAGLPDTIERWLHSTGSELETGPLAAYTALSNRAESDWQRANQIRAHPDPRVRKWHGGEALVQMRTQVASRLSNRRTGKELTVESTITGVVLRLTEHGWRVTDQRGDYWVSTALCLRQGRRVGKAAEFRQVGSCRVKGTIAIDSLIYIEMTNPTDAPVVVGCACPLVAQPEAHAHKHPDRELLPGSLGVLMVHVSGTGSRVRLLVRPSDPARCDGGSGVSAGLGDLSGGEILVNPVRDDPAWAHRAVTVTVPIQFHHRPLARRGWCRHSAPEGRHA
jgi:hypothetical protein